MGVKTKILLAFSLSLSLLMGLGGLARAQGGDVENGRSLFGEYCAVCHGYDGQGRVGANLADWFGSINPEAFVKATVSDGVAGTMPAFVRAKGGPLSENEIDDIAAYIVSWQDRVEPAPTPTPIPVTPIPKVAGVAGDPTTGAQVYARECQMCHGQEGRGGIGASLSGPIAAAQPAAFIRQIVVDGVEGSPMPAFRGALSTDEIENVVAFVLSWDHKPPPAVGTEPEDEDGFIWSLGYLFVALALVVVAALVIRFSQRRVVDR